MRFSCGYISINNPTAPPVMFSRMVRPLMYPVGQKESRRALLSAGRRKNEDVLSLVVGILDTSHLDLSDLSLFASIFVKVNKHKRK